MSLCTGEGESFWMHPARILETKDSERGKESTGETDPGAWPHVGRRGPSRDPACSCRLASAVRDSKPRTLVRLPLPAKEAPRRAAGPLLLFFSHFSVGSSPRRLLPPFLKRFPSLGLSPPLLFLPRRRRRLGERRRHLSCLRPGLCRRRAHPPGMPAPSLSFCCVRRSTPNPNRTI